MRSALFLSTVLAVSTSVGMCAPPDYVGSSSPLTLERTTQVPGDVLKAGSYTISITEQLADRMIVRIDSTTSTNHAIFLGVPSLTGKMGGGAGVLSWGVGVNKTPTLRGFVFSNGSTVEFVYPKAEAAALAKENAASVVAVDPRSEGRVALKSLSPDELQIVNLWLLSLTSAGANDKTPAIMAKHYDGPQSVPAAVVAKGVEPVYPIAPRVAAAAAPVVQRTPAAPVMVAKREPVVPPVAAAKPVQAAQAAPTAPTAILEKKPAAEPVVGAKRVPVARPAPVMPVEAAPVQVASVEEPAMPKAVSHPARQAHVIAQLPHTGSVLPVVWMIGLLSLLGAGLIRLGRGWMGRRVLG